MPARFPSSLVPYAVTVAGVAVAVLVRWLLDPFLGDHFRFAILYGAVALAIGVGGYRPALLATFLGYLACKWLFIEPQDKLDFGSPSDLIGLVFYLGCCGILIGFGEALHAARRRFEAQQHALEKEIGQRQQAEEEVVRLNRELQSRIDEFQAVLNVVPVGVGIAHDPECLRITHNPYMSDLLGLPVWANASLSAPPEERPTSYKVFQDSRELAPEQLPMQRACTGVEVRDCEVEIVRVGQEPRHLVCHARPLRDAQGRMRGSVSGFLDITERKRAEEALRRTTEHLRIVTDNMAAIVTRCSRDLTYLWVSKPYADWIGRPVEEIRGQPIRAVLGPEAFERLQPYFERVLAGEVVRYEARIPFQGIGPRWISTVYTPTRDAEGTCDGWVAVINDIEQRKQMEESLRESEQRSSADLRAMMRLQEVGSLCAAKDSDFQHCSREILDAAIALTGADKGSIQLHDRELGTLQLIAQRGFPESFLRSFATITGADATSCAAAMRAGERVIVEDMGQSGLFARLPALKMFLDAGVCAVQSTPLLSSSNQLIGMVSTYFGRPHRPDAVALRWMDLLARQAADFLERRQAVEELRKLNGELREAERRKDEFLATLAHELRNPLAPLRNGLELLRHADGDGRLMEHARGLMDRQLQRLVRLVDDLLDVSRITRGKVQLRKERLELAAVVANAVEAARPAIEAHRHQLSVTLPPEPIVLDADPVRLAQVFANLLDNAAKYTDNGGHIGLTAERRGGEVVVCVRDTGIGIAPEYLPQLFQMFEQAAPALERAHGGLGIGLSLVRGLVELHGGHIEAHSAGIGKGSEFVVYLPEADGSLQAVLEPVPAVPEAHAPGRRRILVADDSPDIVESLAVLLQLMGHEVQTAHDGRKAVAAAASFQPEIALLDIGMPEMNGYEAARRIRGQPGGQEIILVALTGWGQDQDKRRAAEAGFDHHLTKPASTQALQEVLAMVKPSPAGQSL